jgi:malate permease and related proteins
MAILNTLAPVFLIIAFGYALRRGQWLGDAFLKEANRVVYWIGLPAYLLITLATAPHGDGAWGRLTLMLVGATLATIVLGWSVGRWLGVPQAALGTFVQAGYRGNLAYVALPVLGLLLDGSGPLYTAALLAMAPLMALFNVAAVILLLGSRGTAGPGMAGRVGREVIRNPLIWACLVGGVYGHLGWPVPEWLAHTVGTIGQMSLPLALICIGGALAATRLAGNRRRLGVAVALKLIAMPACGWLGAWAFGFTPAETQVGLILLATPTAAASYTMAAQLGGDVELAAGSVALSTLGSVVALAVIVAWVG